MAVYQTFIQHILASLSENGKAAIVVPTGFTSADTGIAKGIKQELVDNEWLVGVIHMPSNIFANTPTSVSIIFIDKSKQEEVMLIDGSHLGKKIKLDEGQRTVLNEEERKKLIETFKERKQEEEFSALVTNTDIKELNYTISAGHYIELKEEELDYDIDEKIGLLSNKISEILGKSETIDQSIKRLIAGGKHNES